MFSTYLFLLLTLPGLSRADFALVTQPVKSVLVSSQSENEVDYWVALPIAKKMGKSLAVCKNIKDVTAYKKKAHDDGYMFCVSNDSVFKDGLTEFIFKEDGLYSKESLEAVQAYNDKKTAETILENESCSDGSCGVQSSGGFRMSRGASSCSSCQ